MARASQARYDDMTHLFHFRSMLLAFDTFAKLVWPSPVAASFSVIQQGLTMTDAMRTARRIPRATIACTTLLLIVAVTLPCVAAGRTGIPIRHSNNQNDKNNNDGGPTVTEPENDPDCWCQGDRCFRCGIHLLNEECIKIDSNGHCEEVDVSLV